MTINIHELLDAVKTFVDSPEIDTLDNSATCLTVWHLYHNEDRGDGYPSYFEVGKFLSFDEMEKVVIEASPDYRKWHEWGDWKYQVRRYVQIDPSNRI